MTIGNVGNGTLSITNGGNVTSGSSLIGGLVGSTSSVVVDGTGSAWYLNAFSGANLMIGGQGNGSLTISDGGNVSGLASIILGNQAGSNGTLTISGANSLLNFAVQNPAITVGANGNGVLNVEGGANLTVGLLVGANGIVNQTGGTVTLSFVPQNPLFSGIYNLQNGTLNIKSGDALLGSGVINLAGGTLQSATVGVSITANGTLADNTTNFIDDATTLPSSEAFIDEATYAGVLSGGGSLDKIGNGIFVLFAANTYVGATTISDGTLALVGNGSIASSSAVNLAGGNLDVSALNGAGTFTIGANQTLAGSGSIISSGNLAINGTVAPQTTGPLMVSGGNVSLNGVANFTLNDLSHYSQLSSTGTLAYGGNLTLNLGNALFNGIYNLFSFGSQSGDFLGINLTGLFTGSLADSAGIWSGTQSTEDFSFSDATGQLTISDSFLSGASATKQAWLQSNFNIVQLANAAVSGDNASPAGDGIPNFFKYAFNLDAMSYGQTGMPQPAIMNGNLVLSFTAQPDITYTVEASTDLVTWTTTGVTQQTNGSQVTAAYPLPPSGTAFLHVVVAPAP